MTDKYSILAAYRKVCSLRDFLELQDELGRAFTRTEAEALVGAINGWYALIERRKR